MKASMDLILLDRCQVILAFAGHLGLLRAVLVSDRVKVGANNSVAVLRW